MEGATGLLAQFARLVAQTAGGDVLQLLADAAVDNVKVDAAAVVRVEGATAVISASRNLPAEARAWTGDADEIDSGLASQLLALTGTDLAGAYVRLLISDARLFGALVLFSKKQGLDPKQVQLTDALVDLAATALGKSARLAELQQTGAELRATQRALAQAEKLRALGEMAAGVSHDLKNVLNPMSMYVQLAERSLAHGKVDDVKGTLHDMRETVARGLQTIERLRDYARQSPESVAGVIHLDAIGDEAVDVAKPRLSGRKSKVPRIEVVPGGAPTVTGNKAEILDAVVNLVLNAIDALADAGGKIKIVTGQDERGAFLRVEDDGPGMSPEIERRVFEPFFTTKGEEGTGLGLAMVYASMQRHAGSVELVTGPGKGTAFTLRFPRPSSDRR